MLALFTVHEGAIRRKVELDWGTEDSEYLQKVELHCEGALNELRPDIIVYNAGTDILDGDPLGGLSISPQVKRLLIFLLFCGFVRVQVCCCINLCVNDQNLLVLFKYLLKILVMRVKPCPPPPARAL